MRRVGEVYSNIQNIEQARLGWPKPLVTREPGGTPFGERVRQLLLDPGSPDRSILSETFLYAAARAEFVSKIVRPALAQGRIVITERYVDSTWVYQGYAGGVSVSNIESINTIANLWPGNGFDHNIGYQRLYRYQ